MPLFAYIVFVKRYNIKRVNEINKTVSQIQFALKFKNKIYFKKSKQIKVK